jgi:hypothetical protein
MVSMRPRRLVPPGWWSFGLVSGCLYISDKTHEDMVQDDSAPASTSCETPLTFYEDADDDGFGAAGTEVEGCAAPDGFVDNADDCDDQASDDHPGAIELCDGHDNDCDGMTDGPAVDGWTTWYADEDADGWGQQAVAEDGCSSPAGSWATDPGDCDDTDEERNPGASEWCDGIDNDCDLDVDEGAVDATSYYQDVDEDGYGDPDHAEDACAAPKGTSAEGGDCDDDDPGIYPGAPERPIRIAMVRSSTRTPSTPRSGTSTSTSMATGTAPLRRRPAIRPRATSGRAGTATTPKPR